MGIRKSAGLSIVYDDKILLVHPTRAGWWTSFSIPKGKIENGESKIDAAIRETEEEIGIKVDKQLIEPVKMTARYRRRKKNGGSGRTYKKVYHYLVKINSLEDIGLTSERIPKNQLELREVDWAGFYTFEEARKRLSKNLKPVIDQIKEIL